MSTITINEEALISSRLATDIDSFRRRYTMKEISDTEEILIQFVAPKIICLEDYRFFLLQNSRTEILQSKYYFRPDYLSYDEYDTTNLWNLLMFINDIPTLEEFNKENVLIPSRSSIMKIAKDVVLKDPVNELVPLNEIFRAETEKLFYAPSSLPNLVKPIEQKTEFIPSNLYFYKELFIMDVISVKQRAVDLKFDPIVDSVQIKVAEQPTFIYNKHYTIIKNNGRLNRLTWDPRKILNGVGLVDVLTEEVNLEVQYSRHISE